MSNYIDSDDYEIEKKLAKKRKLREEKQRKKKINRIISLLTTLNLIVGGTNFARVALVRENPFDGYSISSSDFNFKYKIARSRNMLNDESIKESLEYLKTADIKEKKAYALYYAIISNYNFKKEEKKALEAYMNYAIDNKYLNYEKIYDSFVNLSIKRNVDLGDNIVGQFDGNNEIRLSNTADSSTLFHELCHSDIKNKLPLWFEEGLTELITNEYYGSKSGIYGLNKNVIRFICEIIGKEEARDLLFKIEGTGDFNLLTEALINKGIDKKLLQEFYNLLFEYHYYQLAGELKTEGATMLGVKIKGCLAVMYDTVYGNSNNVSGVINKLLTGIDINLEDYKFYYLNSQKIEENKKISSIKYYYPADLCDNLTKDCETIELNKKTYIKITLDLVEKCDKSKLIKSITYYNDNNTINYIMNNDDIVLYESSENNNRNIIDMFIEKYEEIDAEKYIKYSFREEKEVNSIEKNK